MQPPTIHLEDQKKYPLVLPFRKPRPRSGIPNPFFPYGPPEEIVWKDIDPVGHRLIKEINLRPWIATVAYCSGHPADRPVEEETPWCQKLTWNGLSRWNFYQEGVKLERQLRGHRIGKAAYNEQVQNLIETSRAHFSLNVNVYVMAPFLQWLRTVYTVYLQTFMRMPIYKLPEVSLNPMSPIPHFNIMVGYFGVEHRESLHELFVDSLRVVPI